MRKKFMEVLFSHPMQNVIKMNCVNVCAMDTIQKQQDLITNALVQLTACPANYFVVVVSCVDVSLVSLIYVAESCGFLLHLHNATI